MSAMKTVAITGSAGFIGSNLVEACLKKGWNVACIDNLSNGLDAMADPIRVMDLPGSYMFVQADINDTAALVGYFAGCDTVFHLAALPRVSFSVDNPLESHHANSRGTLSVLEAARQAGVKRVVFSCSSSIFGGVDSWPTPEDTATAPLSPYAQQKADGAEYCRLYSELYGLETASLIYYNVYGKYQRTGANAAYNTVITAFMECAIDGNSCRIDGDGLQSRDLTHVDNVVQANILAAEHPGKLLGDRFNIANGETHSILDVYNEVTRLIGAVPKHHVKSRLGDPRKSQADIAKATRDLGYTPSVGFSDGLRKTSEWWLAGCPERYGI